MTQPMDFLALYGVTSGYIRGFWSVFRTAEQLYSLAVLAGT